MKGHKLHQIAHCRDCDWVEEDFRAARKKANIHHKTTGHVIDIETGTWDAIGEKKP